jgi:predicted transcriptional regulator
MGKPDPDFEPDIFDEEDEAAIAAADAEAEADIAAGRVISNEAVIRWLKSLSTDSPLPRPQPGD